MQGSWASSSPISKYNLFNQFFTVEKTLKSATETQRHREKTSHCIAFVLYIKSAKIVRGKP